MQTSLVVQNVAYQTERNTSEQVNEKPTKNVPKKYLLVIVDKVLFSVIEGHKRVDYDVN